MIKEISPPTSPWQPMDSPRGIARLGKMIEELGECSSAASRCLIQGIFALEPSTGASNRDWLMDEIADVEATIEMVKRHFLLNREWMSQRTTRKIRQFEEWHDQIQEHVKPE